MLNRGERLRPIVVEVNVQVANREDVFFRAGARGGFEGEDESAPYWFGGKLGGRLIQGAAKRTLLASPGCRRTRLMSRAQCDFANSPSVATEENFCYVCEVC